LEDITYSDDEEDVDADADFPKFETTITVSHIPTTRILKDHHVTQIIEHQALKDPNWIEAMQEELLQFKMQKEEGIDYEEFFAPVARIEAIRLFLAYASFMGFMVYQMDVKSAFQTIEEEVYVFQPPGFEDLDHPDKKPDGIFISQDKYIAEILRKFGLTDGKSVSTPIDTKKPLVKDPNGKDVNDVTRLQALVDKKKVIITEATIRDALRSDDAESIDCLPNEEIFTELSRMGTSWNKFSSSMALAVICLSTEITKLKQRVKKLERRNKLKVSKLRRLKRVGTAQKVDTSDDIVMDDVSKPGIIADINEDEDVTLKDAAAVAKDVDVVEKDAEIEESVDVQGRQVKSQAQIYQIDLEHADKVLSMQDVELEPAKLKEVVDIVTTGKLMIEVVTAASATITVTTTPIPAATITVAPSVAKRRKGVDKAYARDLEAELNKNINWDDVIDQVQRKEKEDNVVMRYQALKRKPHTEAQDRKNMMIYLRNMVGFKMDYFKGMSYDDIRPIFEKYFNSNVAFLEKTKEQIEEEDNRALKRANESQAEKAAKKQKLDEEVEELKKHLEIVPNDEDDVYTEATPLARKVPDVDYEIYTENNKPYYKIIRADGSLYKGQKLEIVRILWSAHYKMYNYTDDLAGTEKISTYKTVTPTLPKSKGLKASGALSKKSKKPKSKKIPGETKTTSTPKPTEGSKQSYSVSSDTIPNPQDLERNIHVASMRFPSTLDEGTRKSQPLPESIGAKYQEDQTQSTRFRYHSLTKNKEKPSHEEELDTTFGPLYICRYKPQSSHAPSVEASNTDSSCDDIIKKYDNSLLLTERQLLKYIRKVSTIMFDRITEDNWEKPKEAKTDKLVEASMISLNKSSTTYHDLYKDLNVIIKLLKEINNSIKDDPVINKKISEATKSFTKISTSIIEVLSLVKGFKFSDFWSSVNALQAPALKQDEKLATWAKSSTNMAWNLGSRLSEENDTNTATEDPPSHTMRETDTNRQEKFKKPKHSTDTNIEEGKGIATDEQVKDQRKLVKASFIIHLDHDALIPYTINGEVYYLTAEQLQAYMDKEDKIKKVEEEAKLFAISKPEVMKVVEEESKKLGIYPKEEITTKSSEKFKKAQDAEHDVLKRQHIELKPETITDIKIHLKTKPVVIIVVKGTDGRNFDVHKPFAFSEFGISKLDELKKIIPKQKNTVVQDLMNSLSQRLEYNQALLENVLFVNNMVIEELEHEIFLTDEFGDQAFQRCSDIDKVGIEALVSYLVAASMVQSPENARFNMKLKKFIVEHLDQEKLK
nr:putative ribonuclease H-like domain-containing protein [Tanacetum cinerariifolium]